MRGEPWPEVTSLVDGMGGVTLLAIVPSLTTCSKFRENN